ncbi:MAG: hypothetical protein ACLUPV_06655 [Bilophila wadsworthia]
MMDMDSAALVVTSQPVARVKHGGQAVNVAAHGFACGQLDFADNDIEAELFGKDLPPIGAVLR